MIKGLAIIDNGSGITLIDRRAVDKLNIPESCKRDTDINLNTINGTCEKKTRDGIKGLCIKPYYSEVTHPCKLEECVSFEYLPSAAKDIASAEEVKGVKEFEHLHKEFPEKPNYYPTILLIGRDNLWSMEHLDEIKAPAVGKPMAVKTRIGWALIGPKVRI